MHISFLSVTGITHTFAPACNYCGVLSDLAFNEDIRHLQESFGTVRPICNTCFDSGLKPNVRNAVKVGQGRKRKRWTDAMRSESCRGDLVLCGPSAPHELWHWHWALVGDTYTLFILHTWYMYNIHTWYIRRHLILKQFFVLFAIVLFPCLFVFLPAPTLDWPWK